LVGRGSNTSLKTVKLVNSEGEVQKVLYERNEIEDAIINHNIIHYKKVMKIKAYND